MKNPNSLLRIQCTLEMTKNKIIKIEKKIINLNIVKLYIYIGGKDYFVPGSLAETLGQISI